MIFAKNKKRNPKDVKVNPPRNRPQPDAPVEIVSATKSGSVLTLVFTQAVTLEGVPPYPTDVAGATPVSVAQPNPITVEITYSASIAAATQVTIPYGNRAIRNGNGGFVYCPTFPLAA